MIELNFLREDCPKKKIHDLLVDVSRTKDCYLCRERNVIDNTKEETVKTIISLVTDLYYSSCIDKEELLDKLRAL